MKRSELELVRDGTRKLVDFYRQNRPEVKVVRLRTDAFDHFIKNPDIAHECGFTVAGEELWYEDFGVRK